MTYGYGSVYQRRNGRWAAAVDLPRERGAARCRRTFTGATREAVEQALADFRASTPPRPHLGRDGNLAQARAQGTHTRGEWFALVRAVKSRCAYCGVKTNGFTCETDHMIPLSRGGSDAIDNICVACRDCNREKGTMTADEYRAWKARQ